MKPLYAKKNAPPRAPFFHQKLDRNPKTQSRHQTDLRSSAKTLCSYTNLRVYILPYNRKPYENPNPSRNLTRSTRKVKKKSESKCNVEGWACLVLYSEEWARVPQTDSNKAMDLRRMVSMFEHIGLVLQTDDLHLANVDGEKGVFHIYGNRKHAYCLLDSSVRKLVFQIRARLVVADITSRLPRIVLSTNTVSWLDGLSPDLNDTR